jgi:hypothetical protein
LNKKNNWDEVAGVFIQVKVWLKKKSRPIGTRRDGRGRIQVEEQVVDTPPPNPSSLQLAQTSFEPYFYLYKSGFGGLVVSVDISNRLELPAGAW